MARFPRPSGAIKDVNELKDGDILYHVYGIWPPCVGESETVKGSPVQFKDHREYAEIHSLSADHWVFDTLVPSIFPHEASYLRMHYASDGNMQPGFSHNDNYWFRSLEEAVAARLYLHEQWVARPDLIEDEKRWRESFPDDDDHLEARSDV